MKQLIKIVALAVMFFAVPAASSAQKVGHLNVDSLLKIWPAYQQVVDSLSNYQIQAQKTIQTMQIEYAAKQREIDSTKSTSTPLLQALRENQLKQIEDNLYAYVQLAEQEAAAIQTKLVDTLYKQLNGAIEAVAKEKGYKYILDSSNGGQVLYADPADDVFEAVRMKLKIPVPTKPAPKPGTGPAPAPTK
jgi:outer membrane protein